MESTGRVESDLATAFLRAPVALVVARHRIIQACNDAFAELFGAPAATFAGRSLAQIYPSLDAFAGVVERWIEPLREAGRFCDERFMKRADGEAFWCRVAGRTLTPADPLAFSVWTFTELPTPAHLDHTLSRRERDVACYVVSGKTSKEIAKILGVSPRTVEGHRARLMRKLKVRNATELNAKIKGPPP